MKTDLSNEIGAAAAKVSLPAAVAGASVAGWGVAEWMYAGTLGYICLQAAYLCWKWVHEWRERRAVARLAVRMELPPE